MTQSQRFAAVLQALSIKHLQPVYEVRDRLLKGDNDLIDEALQMEREMGEKMREAA